MISLRDRIVVMAVTLGVFNFEWIFLELIRSPYRPPDDMSTLLGGTEIVVVENFMGLGAIAWLICVAWFWSRFTFTRTDYIGFTAVCGALLVAAVLIIRYPIWPVARFELIWK